ncbi:hypothetical protein GCM10009801_01330 [Streptomyces albiaxialis]|uniref:Secreted protein n=1 Tax=Streptomyces albiaxialis TaxID=329523 RepID=A0ABN2VDX4_9ACTN
MRRIWSAWPVFHLNVSFWPPSLTTAVPGFDVVSQFPDIRAMLPLMVPEQESPPAAETVQDVPRTRSVTSRPWGSRDA